MINLADEKSFSRLVMPISDPDIATRISAYIEDFNESNPDVEPMIPSLAAKFVTPEIE